MCLSVCLKSHLTYGASVRPENPVTYSAGNEGQNICGDLPETTAFKNYAAKHMSEKANMLIIPTYRCQLSPLDTQRRARGYPTIVNNIQPCPKLCLLMPLARVGARTDSTTSYSYNARRGQFPRTRIGIVRRTRAKHAVCAEGLHFGAFHLGNGTSQCNGQVMSQVISVFESAALLLHLIWPGHPPFLRASRLHDLRCGNSPMYCVLCVIYSRVTRLRRPVD